MNNLKIGRKLTLAFGILLIISMCTSFYTVSKLKEAGGRMIAWKFNDLL